MDTVWVQEDRYNAHQTKVYFNQPDGRLGWSTEEVALFGELQPIADRRAAYAIKVIYSTGNSFGSESGLVTVAAVAATTEKAVEIKDAIEQNADGPQEYYIEIDGVDLHCHTWTGYFESVEAVVIEFVEVVDLP